MGKIERIIGINIEGDKTSAGSTYFFREQFNGPHAFEDLIKYIVEHGFYEKITVQQSFKAPPEEEDGG